MATLPCPTGGRAQGHGALIFWGGQLLNEPANAPLSARAAPSKGAKVSLTLPPLSARRAVDLDNSATAITTIAACAALLQRHPGVKNRLRAEDWAGNAEVKRHLEDWTGKNVEARRQPMLDGSEGGHPFALPSAPLHGLPLVPKPPSRQQPLRRRPSNNKQYSSRRSSSAGVEGAGPLPMPPSAPDPYIVGAGGDRGLILRGELDEHITAKKALDVAIAHRRRTVSKEAGEAHRSAVQRRHSREQEEQRQAATNDKAEPIESVAVAQTPTKEGSPRRASQRRRAKCVEPAEAIITPPSETRSSSENRNASIFEFIKPKNSLFKRMNTLDSCRKEERKMNRMQKLLESKREEFEKRPEMERRHLTDAFQKHDKDVSGSLDEKEMIACVADLGLKPHTQVECREIGWIAQEVAVLGTVSFIEFVFEMVPRVRAKLRELRSGALQVDFDMFDQDGSGYLDRQECMEVLEMLCTANLDPQGLEEMERIFHETIIDVADEEDQVDFDAFQELVGRSREHHQRIVAARISEICSHRHLEANDVKPHADELVLLHHSFKQMESSITHLCSKGSLGWDGVRLALIEYGLLPRNEEAEAAAFETFSKTTMLTGNEISFSKFLKMVRSLRKGQLAAESYSVREMFDHLDRDRNKCLEISEVSPLLEAFGVQPKCVEDQMKIKHLLDEVDEDESGNLSFEEFSVLVLRVREHLAAGARRRQRVVANRLSFGDRQVAELRDVFFRLDAEQDGFLRIDQLRKALDMLKLQMSPENLRALVAKTSCASPGLVNFESFMQFFAKVAPPCK